MLKNMLYWSILLLFMIPTSVSAQEEELPLWFEELDFDKNVNRWFKVRVYGEKVFHNALFVNPKKDFRLTATFESSELEDAAKWGLSWGRKDATEFFHFEINSRKEFRIGRQYNGKYKEVERWISKTEVILADKNELEIYKKGQTLIFLINGTTVYKMPYQPFQYSGVALRSSAMQVKFKHFAIYQDQGAIQLPDEGAMAATAKAKNLGEQVNSTYVDKSPVISPDGKTLYFIREDAAGGFGGQDIYYSERQPDGTWSAAKNIGSALNNTGNNFVNAVMPDNNTLMTINAYERYAKDDVLAFTYRTATGWSRPMATAIRNFNHIGRWVSFDLAASGQVLVFSAWRPDSRGGRDLYVSFLRPDGNFSEPMNLGATLNTTGNEHCPFLAADGKTLYFDTDGHPGYGGRDIFMTKRLDDTWTNWSTPQNLGPVINTIGADEGLVLPASGEYAYFVSDQDSYGGYDIYSLELPPSLRPEPTAILSGRVTGCETDGIPATILVYEKGKKEIHSTARTDPSTGKFQLALIGGASYEVKAILNTLNLESKTITIDLNELQQYEEQALEILRICPPPPPPPIAKGTPDPPSLLPEFEPVHFNHDRYDFTPEALKILDTMVDTLQAYPEVSIKMFGHTDSNGSDAYNVTLALNRVNAVMDYLQEKGIEKNRLKLVGFGETMPIDKNSTAKGRANNRRVEFEAIFNIAWKTSD